MPKQDPVERLMALATEKRADRTPPPLTVSVEPPSSVKPAAPTAGTSRVLVQRGASNPTAGERGRQVLQAIRPLLPAVAGAMRLVDHGAVQAIARLLPLLGGASLGVGSGREPAQQEQVARDLTALQTAVQEGELAHSREIAALHLQVAECTDEARRLRSLVERVESAQATSTQELRSVTDRSRLLTAGVIILLMLVVAQMILLVAIFHK